MHGWQAGTKQAVGGFRRATSADGITDERGTLERRRLDADACDPALAGRLRARSRARCCSIAFDRGRYSTDASIYQVEPLGVVVPRTDADVQAALAIAREYGVPVTAARRRHLAVPARPSARPGHRLLASIWTK